MAASPQLRLPLVPKKPKTWGGKRAGAGRPRKGPRASEPHKRRPRLLRSEPVHVTCRVVAGVTRLRTRDLYRAIREATIAVADRPDVFRIIHLSIQHNHLHLLAEAADRLALAHGMKAFEVSAARQINAALGRRGQVFADRYHARILRTPQETRNAINYVLNNWRHHGEDRDRTWQVDPFSSGVQFGGWKELEDSVWMFRPPTNYDGLIVWRPKTWLLHTGWMKARRPSISVRDVPGPDAG